jgi:hypothetical protein
MGTHPEWITAWLARRGVRAYYFTGNSGLGPTRTYRDGKRSAAPAWAFPVLTRGRDASFEELDAHGVGDDAVGEWLAAAVDFAARERVLRLVYFHPPGLEHYPQAVQRWLERSALRAAEGSFRWYTMAEIAAFLSERERVAWTVGRRAAGDLVLRAEHPATLARQSFTLPAAGFAEPVVVEGDAEVLRDPDRWLVRARGGKRLVVATAPVPTRSPRSELDVAAGGRGPGGAHGPAATLRIGRRTP